MLAKIIKSMKMHVHVRNDYSIPDHIFTVHVSLLHNDMGFN